VRIDPDPVARAKIVDRAAFQTFLRDLFTQRRKLLRGMLGQMFKGRLSKPDIDAIMTELQLPAGSRAEELEVEQLVSLSNRLQSALSGGTNPPSAALPEPQEFNTQVPQGDA
jgi:16S rRNA A1518/A1519 N6-dimethyltransferase RsmA/KsgA/DIM1 with predicted DNA glycosylase/AP lyase activity